MSVAAPAVERTWGCDDAYVHRLLGNLDRVLHVTRDLVNLPPGTEAWCAARERARELLKAQPER